MEYSIKYRVIKDSLSMLIAQALYKIITFVMMIIVARFLGVEGFGQLSYGLSFVWIFLFLSDFGMSELFIRDVSSNNVLMVKYINNILTIKLLLGVAAYIALVILAYFFSFSSIKFWVILLLGAAIILDSFMYFFRCLFRIKEVMEYEGMLMVIEAILKIGIVFWAIKSGIGLSGVILVATSLLIVSILNFIINLTAFTISYRFFSFSAEKKFCFHLLKSAFPFAIIYILSLLNFRIDVIMLSLMKGDIYAGWYNADYKLVEQILLIPITLSAVFLPVFSKFANSLDHLKIFFRNSLLLLSSLSILALILFYIFGVWAVKVIYGMAFNDATAYLPILSWVFIPFFLKVALEKLLFSLRKQIIVCLVYLSGVILNILLNIILIPKMGINGASLGTVLSETAVLLIFIFIFSKKLSRVSVTPVESLDIDKQTLVNELI